MARTCALASSVWSRLQLGRLAQLASTNMSFDFTKRVPMVQGRRMLFELGVRRQLFWESCSISTRRSSQLSTRTKRDTVQQMLWLSAILLEKALLHSPI